MKDDSEDSLDELFVYITKPKEEHIVYRLLLEKDDRIFAQKVISEHRFFELLEECDVETDSFGSSSSSIKGNPLPKNDAKQKKETIGECDVSTLFESDDDLSDSEDMPLKSNCLAEPEARSKSENTILQKKKRAHEVSENHRSTPEKQIKLDLESKSSPLVSIDIHPKKKGCCSSTSRSDLSSDPDSDIDIDKCLRQTEHSEVYSDRRTPQVTSMSENVEINSLFGDNNESNVDQCNSMPTDLPSNSFGTNQIKDRQFYRKDQMLFPSNDIDFKEKKFAKEEEVAYDHDSSDGELKIDVPNDINNLSSNFYRKKRFRTYIDTDTQKETNNDSKENGNSLAEAANFEEKEDGELDSDEGSNTDDSFLISEVQNSKDTKSQSTDWKLELATKRRLKLSSEHRKCGGKSGTRQKSNNSATGQNKYDSENSENKNRNSQQSFSLIDGIDNLPVDVEVCANENLFIGQKPEVRKKRGGKRKKSSKKKEYMRLKKASQSKGKNEREEANPVERAPCKFYLTNKCNQGDDCKFRHDGVRRKEACKFYKIGFCSKGEGCVYMHDILS